MPTYYVEGAGMLVLVRPDPGLGPGPGPDLPTPEPNTTEIARRREKQEGKRKKRKTRRGEVLTEHHNTVTSLTVGMSCLRKQKELMKALETPEEKRQRRLAKKEAKDRKQREKEGWDKDYLVSEDFNGVEEPPVDDPFLISVQTYTNTDNPFGDHHLLQKFVWKEVSTSNDLALF